MHCILDAQAIATKEFNSHLEEQAESIAPSSLEKLPIKLRGVFIQAAQDFLDVSQLLLEQVFDIGRRLQEKKQLHSKGKRKYEWQIYLGQIGWTVIKANKYIKLVQIFGDIGAFRLRKIELSTLFNLCRSTYADVVEKMRSTAELTEVLVQQWMKEERPKKLRSRQDPITGWKPMPSGGGRYYGIFLHDEETGISIEEQASSANLLPQQIIKEAVELRKKTILDHTAIAEADKQRGEDLRRAHNWQMVASICGENRFAMLSAIKDWTEVEKQRLVNLLAAFLIEHTGHRIEHLFWVPQRLLLLALQRSNLLHPKYFVA